MKLHLIKAAHGDGLLLESGDEFPKRVLIDGGPRGCWDEHLEPHLKEVLQAGAKLDALLVSHVDLDHIVAPLDLFAELERRRVADEPKWPEVCDLWHNSFERTLDTGNVGAAAALRLTAASAASIGADTSTTEWTIFGISQGAQLRRSAIRESVSLNKEFDGELICPDNLANPVVAMGSMSLQFVGPTRQNLDALRREWLAWAEKAGRSRRPEDFANVDRSVPNLSSIVVLAREGGRTALLTGDARGDHIEQGLEQAGLLVDGRLHVNVLKLQHHGSARNVDVGFFDRITADVYVVSANGKYDNPDISTLRWIVASANNQKREIKIVATFETPSIITLKEELPPSDSGYSVSIVKPDKHAEILTV